MKMYIARDRSGELWLYQSEPICRNEDGSFYPTCFEDCRLLDEDFPEVTFENSPMEVELKLIDK